MSKVIVTASKLDAIVNAINSKTGKTGKLTLDEMITEIEDISGGDHTAEDEIVTKDVSGDYVNNRITSIGYGAFYNCTKLTSVSFPLVTYVDNYVFYNCQNLNSASFPSVTSIGNSIFRNCAGLTDLVIGTNNGGVVSTYASASSSFDPSNTALKIYVPDDLVSSYKKATNWSRLANHFYPISERPEE